MCYHESAEKLSALCIMCDRITMILCTVQVPWIPASIWRFNHPECNETRTWEVIARTYKSSPHLLSVGGLGDYSSTDFEAWACFHDHPCFHKVAQSAYTDAMCYVYHERTGSWYAWTLKSELSLCPSG
jgi:hypothetical protein